MKQLTMFLIAGTLFAATGCKKDDDNCETPNTGVSKYSITFFMKHLLDGDSLELDTMKYTNAFGNMYKVENLKYLISNITLHGTDGTAHELTGYHYVDIHDQNTWEYTPSVQAPAGDYEKITFTMGFDEMDNIDGAYSDLNILNWGWPMMLGGGYHFMKLEGKYIDTVGVTQNFATHYGTAREMTTPDPTFHANHFFAELPDAEFHVDGEVHIDIEMEVNNWYNGPPAWDFNVWNAPIMPIFEAQVALRNQGYDVFSVGEIEDQH